MKIALTGDLHFGARDSDKTLQDSQFKFVEQLISDCKDRWIKDIYILGDLFDTRHAINVLTINRVLAFFQKYEHDRIQWHILLGNHDLYYKNTIDVNSLVLLNKIDNVEIIDKPTLVNDTLLLPWVTDYEQFRNEVEGKMSCKRMFGHLDVIGAKMDNYNVSENGFTKEELFKSWQYIYSGHYHKHSETVVGENKLIYLGTPYQLTRAEIEEKGFYILDTDTEELEFVKNKHCIEYKKLKYPEKPDDLDRFVMGNIVDVEVSWEEGKYMNKVNDYIAEIESHGPAYPVNVVYQQRKEVASTDKIDASKITILSLGKKYIDDCEDIKNKSKVFDAFSELYSKYSAQ